MIITRELITKIDSLLAHGLVKGLGEPIPGKMCVEAAICYALGEPHNDEPSCVGSKVREYKITLNDMPWYDNQARAKGLRNLAIAQLGSNKLDQDDFYRRVFNKTQLQLVVPLFDDIPSYSRLPEHEELKEFCRVNFNSYELIRKFSPYSLRSIDTHKYYNNFYNYYNFHYYYFSYFSFYNINSDKNQKVFQKSADIAVEVLTEMGCEGCKWL